MTNQPRRRILTVGVALLLIGVSLAAIAYPDAVARLIENVVAGALKAWNALVGTVAGGATFVGTASPDDEAGPGPAPPAARVPKGPVGSTSPDGVSGEGDDGADDASDATPPVAPSRGARTQASSENAFETGGASPSVGIGEEGDFVDETVLPTPPGAPQNLLAVPGPEPGSMDLTWDAVEGATGYRVYRGVRADALMLIAFTADLRYEDRGLAPGASYYYAVSAVTGGLEGPRALSSPSVAQPSGSSALPTPELPTLALGLAGLAIVGVAARRRP
ncbi:MAG TPA: fibronectin type III domain-containing protein [Candidatus Thermoplasmatota archaeon]|nr:fibronectin type III domain-containing protein [Candidatus Thermoplasmatota archaeon]